MKKWKRSERIADMTWQLMEQPHHLFSLSIFSQRYGSAKSSISEDLAIVDQVIRERGIGFLETVAGAAGGVRYVPQIKMDHAKELLQQLALKLSDPTRILPGDFLYLSDLLADPLWMRRVGRIWATLFLNQQIDAIVTVATKGIPLAYAVANYLSVPVAIVRQDSRVTEGSVVTVNTVSGSSRQIRTLSLARRSLKEGARVLVVDDFMKAGGTIRGIINLLAEFRAEVMGVGVFVESPAKERLVDKYVSLLTVAELDAKRNQVVVKLGNLFEDKEGYGNESDSDKPSS